MPWPTDTAPAKSQIGELAFRLLPVASTGFAALLALLPVPLAGYAALTPAFALMTVYHWTIYRPDLLPPTALFGIGLVYDLLSGGPLGATPLLFLLSRAAVLRCRRWFFNREFPFIWAGFTLLAGVAIGGLWAVHSILAWQFFSINSSVFRAVLTIALFPIASFALGRTQHALIGAG